MPRLLLTRGAGRLLLGAGLMVASIAAPVAPVEATPAASTTTASSLHHALARYAAGRQGHVVVSVRDLETGTVVTYRPGHPQRTASIVKVELLEAYLAKHHTPLSSASTRRVTRMIRYSDNTAATETWTALGRAKAVNAFSRRIGLTETHSSNAPGPGYGWGNTLTTPADQLRVLDLLQAHNKVLTDRDRRFVRHLMHTVTPSQRWGVTAGALRTGVTVAVKNGWKPLGRDDDWQVNSIGIVRGNGRAYEVAVMTTGNPSLAYGIRTVEGLSRIVWRDVR